MARPLRLGAKRARGLALGYETQHCIWFMEWATLNERRMPVLRRLFHIPNEGKRTRVSGAILKAMGLKAGAWDYFLPAPQHRNDLWFAGLWIEMKSPGEKLTKEQSDFGMAMTDLGYRVDVCYSWVEAAVAVCKYLGKEKEHLAWPAHTTTTQ